MKSLNFTPTTQIATSLAKLNAISSQSTSLKNREFTNPERPQADNKQSFFNDKLFNRNLSTRNKPSSVYMKQKGQSNFKSSAVSYSQVSEKNKLCTTFFAQTKEKDLLNKSKPFLFNKSQYSKFNKLYTSWIKSDQFDLQAPVSDTNYQKTSFKETSNNKTLLNLTCDIYEHQNFKNKQAQHKNPKKQSIKRLQSKVNQYFQLIQSFQKKTQEIPKHLKKGFSTNQDKKYDYKFQISREKKLNTKSFKIYQKESLQTQSQTPTSSSDFLSQNSVKNDPIKIQKIQIGSLKKSQQSPNKIEQIKQLSLSDFLIIKKIGQGRLGQIMTVLHKQTNTVYALKKIKKSTIKQNKLEEQFLKQIKVQSSFDHPNIVKLYGFFDDQFYVYLLLQYCEQGSLDQKMSKRKYHQKGTQLLSQKQTSRCLKDVLKGLNQMHSQQIMHRDIKPANIVISCGVHKICDFGWATPNPDNERRRTYCGTFDYAPPEIFKGETYDLQVDLWELGVMVYQMATGKLPFYKPCQKETLKNVLNYSNQLSFPKDLNLSEDIKQFILDLLQKNPQDRIPTKLLLRHPFIVSIQRQQFQE